MLTLALEAATYAGSVAVLRDDIVLTERTTAMRGAHEERLMPAVAAALEEAGVPPAALDRIVCGSGPGSFTSLRIAASIAKGIASGIERPLFAVSSLVLIVASAAQPAGRFLAVLEALRGEVFAQEVEVSDDGRVSRAGAVHLLPAAALVATAADADARLIGPGQRLEAAPHARGVARIADSTGLGLDAPVELVTWEPRYGRAAEAQVRWEAAHGRPLPRE
jgi:tRNA threonylcarbamoyladenosine biosynthesis protein TsaB